MTNWMKYGAIGTAIFVFFAAVAGCDWGDAVRAETPPRIAQERQIADSIPLNDAVYEYEDWLSDTRRDGERWKAEIEKASQIVAFLDTFTLRALGELGPAVAGVPVLSALVPAVVGIGGLMLKRPGDKSGIEADKLWDEAFAAGKQAALDGVREAKS